MEPTTTTAPPRGRFTRDSEPAAAPPPLAAAPAPPANLANLRTIQRRWPRTVPEKRVFPRG